MGKKSAPPAPDYTAAAEKQAASSEKVTNQQTWANRPDITTPWGTQTWTPTPTYDPTTGQTVQKWAQNITLSPEQQAALDSQMRIQQGRSDAAEQLLGQATSAFQSPVDYSNLPQGGQSVNAAQLQGAAQWGGNPVSGLSGAGDVSYLNGIPGKIQQSVQFKDVGGNSVAAGSASAGRAAASKGVQYDMNSTAGDWRQRAQGAALQFQQPLIDRRRAALESQLSNMGLTRGSEAWNAEMQRDSDQAMRDQLQAFGAGQSEANMLFNQDLASSQFRNAAQQQDFNQSLSNEQMALQASIANAANTTQAGIASANLAQQAQIANNANILAGAQFGNQSQQQMFNQLLAGNQFNNQAQAQAFGQKAADATFQNQAAQQNFQNQMTAAGFNNQAALQQQNAGIQAGQYNQQLRQQNLSEQLAQRAQPLNELNALLTGQQVGMPQMPSFNTAQASQATNYMGAAQNQYQAALDAQNMQAGMAGNLMGGLFSLGGAAMQSGGWGGLFSMSDARLKTNVVKLGAVDGVNVYAYDYIWGGPREVGVMAQEVPHAAVKHPSGYLMVDYSKVWK